MWHFVTESAETKTQAKITLFADRLTQMVRDYGTGYEGDTTLEVRVKVVPKLR